MSPGHSGFIDEYPLIRVDKFTGTLPKLPFHLSDLAKEDLPPHSTHFSNPHIQLLSHTHTDHLVGLSSLTQFSAPIYCSEITKKLLLALERKEDRILFDKGKLSLRKRPYKHLRRTEQECKIINAQSGVQTVTPWDLLIPLPFDTPTVINYNAKTQIRLTLLSANHMPGSTMFLIEGARGAILHTGDLRAEKHFIEDLMSKTSLGRLSALPSPIFITSPEFSFHTSPLLNNNPENPCNWSSSSKLESLYLDTERILDNEEPLPRSKAINDVLQLIKLFPNSQKFHVDLWTSGYEYFLIGLYKLYGQEVGRIHIDRYMFELFQIMSQNDSDYKNLSNMVSQDKSLCGKFCACDWEECRNEEGVVRITPFESMSITNWQEKRVELLNQIKQARKGNADYPKVLPLPIQRHSPLPELYRMITLLKPRNVIANTATPTARFIVARLSEHVGLTGASEAEERSRNSGMSSISDEDEKRWNEMKRAWMNAGQTEIRTCETNEKNKMEEFFNRVNRFRTILFGLRKMESERLLLERLDAASDALLNDQTISSNVFLQSTAMHTNIQQLSNPCPTQTTTTKKQIWEEPGKYASVNASPFMTAAMREEGCSTTSNTAINKTASSSPIQSTQPILTTELASRYLAYAAMYLGWRIRNPSRYKQEIAWRAVRKIKPKLARETEEALQKELGWQIPPWDEVNQSTEVSMGTNNLSELEQQQEQQVALPSTPRPLAFRNLAQSISPLEIGENANALKNQLDAEAESQQTLFSEEEFCGMNTINDQEEQVREAQEILQFERFATPPCGQRNVIVKDSAQRKTKLTLSQLRETVQCLRLGKQSESFITKIYGKSYFEAIFEDWKNIIYKISLKDGNLPIFDKERIRCQLDLIGVSARSQRARKLLGWEDVKFNNIYRILRTLYENNDDLTNLPCAKRAQIVLRFLERLST